MRIGLIARCEYARGLAIQSRNFYDNMPVDSVLLVRMPEHRLDCPERPEWYPGAQHIAYDIRDHSLPEDEVRAWMENVDVVFTVETTYDWRLADWARSMGVRTVIQGNPEFYRHGDNDGIYRAQPDAWWWPTPWRTERLPHGRVVPVPMPARPNVWRVPEEGRRPNYLHVVGKMAYEDRNGTQVVINSLRSIQEQCDVTLHGFGWELQTSYPLPPASPVHLTVDNVGVDDRWSMYADKSLLVVPRRYGGLCLPALEAAACGVPVLMSQCSPNEVLAHGWLSCTMERQIRLACGPTNVADVDFRHLAEQLDTLTRNPDILQGWAERAYAGTPRWSDYRSVYLEELERVCR